MKTIGIIVAVVAAIIVAVVVYLAQNVNSLVEGAIEDLGSEYLGTSVSVGSVDISLTERTGSIVGLEIANPSGYDGPYLMQLDEITVGLNLDESSTEVVSLSRVVIDGARIAAIVKTKDDSNLQALMNNLESKTGSSDEPEEASSGETKIIIDQLDFTNAEASVDAVLLGKTYEANVADVHLKGVGRKENGATAGEAIRQLLKPVTDSLLKEIVQRGLGVDQEGLKQKLLDKIPGYGSGSG